MKMNNPHGIRLIAVDIDGTLLNDAHELTPTTEAAVRKAVGMGIHVVLATGKTRASAVDLIQRLGLQSPGVFSQGLIIADPNGTIRHQTNLADALAREIAEAAQLCGLSFVAYRDQAIYCLANDVWSDLHVAFHEPLAIPTGTIDGLMARGPFQKFIFMGEPDQLAERIDALRSQFTGKAAMVYSNPRMLEFLPPGASKGAGVLRLLEELAIDPAEMIAFGDADNDIEMLEVAGIGVAMGNAMAGPRAVADYITDSNNADGVARALDHFLFHNGTSGIEQK